MNNINHTIEILQKEVWHLATVEIPALRATLEGLDLSEAGNIVSLVSANTTAISNLSTEVQNISSLVSSQNETLAAQQNHIADISSSLTSQQQSISSLNNSLSLQQESIEDISGTLSSHSTSLTSISDSLSQHDTSLAQLNSKISNIETLSSKLPVMEDNISQLSANVNLVQSNAAAIQENLLEAQTDITALELNLSAMQTTLSSITNRLVQVELKVFKQPTLIYDKTSSDPTIHRNMQSGFRAGYAITHDYTKYKYLRIYMRSGMSGMTSVQDVQIVDGNLKFSLIYPPTNDAIVSFIMSFSSDMATLNFNELSFLEAVGTAGTIVDMLWMKSSAASYGYIEKIEGYA